MVKAKKHFTNKSVCKTKYLFLKNYENLSAEQKERVHYLSMSYPEIGDTYKLKIQFKEIYANTNVEDPTDAMLEWVKLVNASDIYQLKGFVKTLKANWDGILKYFETRATSAFAERVNLKIQEIKRAAKGYRNLDNFKTMIYFHLGGLEINTRI